MKLIKANRIEPVLISIRELSNRWNGMSRQTIWLKVKEGKIPARKIGQNWFIKMDYILSVEASEDNKEQTK